MNPQDPESIAKQWIAAFKEHNIEKLIALYDNNAQHYSPRIEEKNPETKGWLKGKEKLRAWWQESFNALPDLYYELKDLTLSETKVFMEYVRIASDQQDMYVMEYFKIEEGLIIESRVLRSWVI